MDALSVFVTPPQANVQIASFLFVLIDMSIDRLV
jgi:hypothetical protein